LIVATYNLRSGGAKRCHWAKILEEFQPDILLVQETVDPADHLQPLLHAGLLARTTWNKVEGRRWGSALYVGRGEARPIELPDFQGHVVGVEVVGAEWPDGSHAPLRVFNIHAPARGTYLRAVGQILDRIAENARDTQVVIGGDLNISVGVRHASEQRTTSAGNRAILRRLREEFGLVSSWQEANPDRPLAQTLRWTAAPTVPYHCDGLFVPRTWLPTLRTCEVISSPEWDILSDHNPVVAWFDKRPTRKVRKSRARPTTL
jgi:endonuclease/exonuclease/phosphatase family metal-dependent hydrolase